MIIKTLAKNSRDGYASEIVLSNFDSGTRFKIEVEYGNYYSRMKLLIQTKNYDFSIFATGDDIDGFERMNYVRSYEQNYPIMMKNIELAKDYINKCF